MSIKYSTHRQYIRSKPYLFSHFHSLPPRFWRKSCMANDIWCDPYMKMWGKRFYRVPMLVVSGYLHIFCNNIHTFCFSSHPSISLTFVVNCPWYITWVIYGNIRTSHELENQRWSYLDLHLILFIIFISISIMSK